MVNKVTLGTVMDIIAVTPVTKNLRRFLISGITNEEEVYALRRSIESLGGTIEDRSKNKFTSLCTHVIAEEICATEKVLGALAGGKWLLKPAYVKESIANGRWVKENAYEIKDYGEVAKYCRQWKEKRGSGIYSGWTVYIELENPRMTKAFRRIVAAGGAEGVSMSEISKVDLVISEKAICPTIRELVGVTPIISKTYIKDTLILKANPSDLRDYLLDKKSKSRLPNKNSYADIQVLHCDSSLPKRPIFEAPINNNKKLCTRPKIHSALSYQQTSLDRYVRKSPRKTLSSICPVSQVSSKPQNRKYQHFPFTPEKHSTIIKYFAEETRSGGALRNIGQNETQRENKKMVESDNEVEIVKEIKNICEPGTKSNGLPEKINNSYSPLRAPVNVLLKSEQEMMKKKMKERIEKVKNEKMKENEICNRSSSVYNVSEACKSISNSGGKNDSRTTEVYMRNLSGTSPHTHKIASKQVHLLPEWLAKEVRVNIGPKVDRLSYVSKDLKKSSITSKDVVIKPGPVIKKSRESSVHELKLTKDDLERFIVQFVRSKTYNDFYCGNVTQSASDLRASQGVNRVHISEQFDSEQIFYSPSRTICSPEIRELTIQETSYYESSVDQDTMGVRIMTTNEQEIIVQGLESLYLNITPYAYPHDELFGELLKKLVLQTPFSIVHSRALGLAYRVLILHPPVNARMRAYYLKVLKSAMKNEETGFYLAWKFVHSIIEILKENVSSESDSSQTGSDEEETTTKVEHAFRLFQFLIVLFKEDLKHCNNREAVNELLTWRVFWGPSRTSVAVTTPVRQLLQFWVSLHSASRAIRHSLGQLVSILLEVTWRCDSCSIIPVTPVPESVVAIATELCVHLKDCDPQDCLQLLQDLPSPWPRMVICSFILQDIAHISNQEITLGDILDYSYAVGVSQEAENKQSTPIKQNLLHCKEHSSFVSTKSWSSASSHKTRKTRFSAKVVNKKNPFGETPLIRACIKNNVDRMLDLLAVPGIDINLSDNLGWTALHEAAMRGYDECVKMLLTYNCNDNLGQKNILYSYVRRVRHTHTLNTHARGGVDKRTPLHDAVQYNHFSTVKLLLDYGGAGLLKLETKDGKTPRDFASNNEMRHLLRSYQEKSPISIAQGDENYQTYIKLPIISCGLNIPNRFFSSHDSHMNFIVTFANCFMEVSGSRFIQIAIEKELYKAQKRRLAEESDTSSAGEATADNRTQGSSYVRTIPLFSQIKPPSDLESALINKIFQSVKLNILMCQEQKKRQLSAEEKSDFLERLQLLFS